MKAKEHSFKCYPILLTFILLLITCGLTSANAQCPTVTNSNQTLCDIQSVLVGDLQAIDNGGGIVWYETATSTTPLSNSASLISGEDYYADDNTGSCGTRARVDIIIYGPPVGSNFQGVCLDDPTLATVADLDATGNDVQWYLSPSGGTPLNDSDILMDDTLYYADQASPDGSCRTSRLSVLVNVGATPIPVGDMVQSFCSSSEFTPTVGDLVASGDNNWYISLFSAFPLPLNTPLINGQTYYGTTLDPPCESSARLMVMVILDEGPNAGEDGVLDICDNNSTTTYDLFSSLGGTPDAGGSWSPALNSGSGVYDPNIDPAGIYTYTVSSGNSCPDDSATVTVTLIPEPNAGTNGTLDLCSNEGPTDLFLSLGGTPELGGIWSPALASGTGVFDPAIDPEGIYTYTLSGTDPCVDAMATVTVSITTFEDAGEDGTIDICDSNGTIDLFDSLGGTPDVGGVWTPALNSGTGIFDPLIDSPGVYTYSFMDNAPCIESSATVTVTVIPLPNAGSNGTLNICSDDFTIVDLFDNLGGTPEVGGTWSPSLNSGTGLFDPSIDPAGIYTYTISGTPPCIDVSAEVNVSITEAPDAGTDAIVDICDNEGTINLFDTLEGTPDVGGTWSPTLSSGTNIFDPLIDAEGTYTYTVTGIAPCADATATVTITVSPFQDAGLDGSVTVCSENGTIDLFNSLGGTPSSGGTWSPALSSGSGIFDPLVDTAGFYTYTTSGIGPCIDDFAVVEVIIELTPDAGLDGTLTLCSLSSTADLFDSLGGMPQPGGTWSPALSSGTGIFDASLDLEGDYTYTISSALCGNSSATVTVSVIDANQAGGNGALELCFNDTPINLFDSLGETPDLGGTWSPTLSSGTGIFDPSIDPSGVYTYSVSNSTTVCPDDSATVIVSVIQEPNAGNDGTLNLCDSTNTVDLFNSLAGTPETGGIWTPTLSSGTGVFDPNTDPEGIYTYTLTNACGTGSATVTVFLSGTNDAGTNGTLQICATDSTVDLFNSLGGTPDVGGTWSPSLASGTGIFDPMVDSSGIYTYTISNASTPCPDATATVIVSVIQEPDAGNDGTLNLCDSTNTVDLFNGLAGTPQPGGTWTPTLTSGTGIFDPNTDPEGIYTYTLTNSCGTSSATVTVSLSNTNDAGTDGSIELCITDATIDLFNSLGGTPDIGGTWTPALTSGTGIFDPMVDAAGVYTYTVSNAGTPCPDATATVTVSVLESPDAGNDGTLNLCDSTNTIDLFTGLAGTPEPGGTWSPALNSGTGIFDPNIDPEGTYTYTLTNSCGTSSATVTVSLSNMNNAGTDGALEICASDGSMDLFNSLGGTPDIGGTWTPALTNGTGIFDPMVDTAGIYTYTVSSGTPICPDDSATVTVAVIDEPNAGGDGTLNLCDSTASVDLFDSLTGMPDIGGTWSPALASGTGVFDPNIDLEGIYTYTINNICGSSSATVTVSLSDSNDAGTNGSIELCITNPAVDLFNSLGGTPDVGGTWTPTLTSGTGIFDPTVDPAGTYTYTVSSPDATCPDATAEVVVTIVQSPNAGTDGALDICTSDSSVNLFDGLGGTPDTGGTWTPALTSGTGMFDPNVDLAGDYTYTLNNACGTDSAIVTVTISVANDAGMDGSIEFCSNDSATDLFDSLEGTPETDGTWSPALTSGTGVFDPAVDSAGIYTYTVSADDSSCPDATAEVVVTIIPPPNAGIDDTLFLCIDDTDSVNLFNILGGSPDTNGTWSPALTSGTGIFDPTTDLEGVYTYTVTSAECNLTASANITVTILELPDVTGLELSMNNNIVCFGLDDAEIIISGANQLPDGDYTIVYQLSEANIAENTVNISVVNGNSSFIIPQTLLQNPGLTMVTISQLFVIDQSCSAITTGIEPFKILVQDPETPQIIDNGSEFCSEDNPTIADLSANITNINLEDGEFVLWYDQPENGNAFDNSELLQDGIIYYGTIVTANGCESSTRIELTINLIECIGDLLIPDGFSPNNDGTNDVFNILYLDDLYPNFKLSIFNRYGNILYEGNINSPKWDGTSKNNNTVLPVGVYFYILEFNDGETEAVQGRVYLSR